MFRQGKKFFVKGPPPHLGIARNCYGHAAGGMPLAFTQEDFLVFKQKMYNKHLFSYRVVKVSPVNIEIKQSQLNNK